MAGTKSRITLVQNLKGYAFIAPHFMLLFVFSILPIVFSVVLSFTDWDLISGIQNLRFIGLKNFLDLARDQWFITSLTNNVVFTIVVVPVTMVGALFLAILLHELVFLKKLLRLFFFLPHLTNIAAISLIWTLLYSNYGPLYTVLKWFGVANPPLFLADKHWAMPAIMLMTVWMHLGYCMLVYIAGLQAIPEELYESATIDGAGWWRKHLSVTIPSLGATTFFILVTQIINSFKVFGQVQMMTAGGPVHSTSVLVHFIYTNAFNFYKFGYASAASFILFLIILGVTAIQWRTQKGGGHS